ncbi:MAG: sugar ABC transporter substrate-binding protein [Oscillospiraceae bacterium]|nr:sugar ABC transporter substrate-binding protein [Oscillospiraceae bacterium]
MKKEFVKIGCGVLAAAMLTVSLAGCGDSGTTSSSAAAASTGSSSAKLSGSITVAGWNDAATALTAEAKEFMKENPGTTVTVQNVDSNYTKLYSELAANANVPDVVQIQNRDMQSFKNKYPDAWTDLTDLVKPEEKNFASTVLPLVKTDNKYWAVPWDLGPNALYYRKDIFQKAGVDANSIKTYDDYVEAGKKILKATGGKTKMLGFDYSGSSSDDTLMMLLNQQGGRFYDSNGKVKLDSAEMINAVNLMNKMKAAGITQNLANEWNDRITATENDQIATIPYAVWYAGTMETSNADQKGKWGIVPLPAFTSGGNTQANLGGSVLAVSSQTQNADLAKAFVKFSLMSSTGNKINWESGKLFTSYTPSYQDAEYKVVDSYFGVSVGATFSKLTEKIPEITFGPYFTDVNNALKTAVGNVFVKSQAPALLCPKQTPPRRKLSTTSKSGADRRCLL